MNFDQLTDENIDALITLPKTVTNPSARWQNKPGHKQCNYKLKGGDHSFELYLRQNLNNSNDFSCGLKIIKPDGQPLTLSRYNSGSHIHGDIKYACHIHRATQKAISAGKKPESHAEQTVAYNSLQSAKACLVQYAAVSGLHDVTPDQTDLFVLRGV